MAVPISLNTITYDDTLTAVATVLVAKYPHEAVICQNTGNILWCFALLSGSSHDVEAIDIAEVRKRRCPVSLKALLRDQVCLSLTWPRKVMDHAL